MFHEMGGKCLMLSVKKYYFCSRFLIIHAIMGKIFFAILFFCSVEMCAQQYAGVSVSAGATGSFSEAYSLEHDDAALSAKGDIKSSLRAYTSVGYGFKLGRFVNMNLLARYEYCDELLGLRGCDWGNEHHVFKGRATFMSGALLWKRPLILMASLGAEAGEWGVERVNFMALAILMIKRTPTVQFGLAAIGMVNTASSIPFFIVPTYRRVLSPLWTLNLNYPFMGMQFTPSPMHTLSAGFTVDNYGYWLRTGLSHLPRTVYYRRSLFKLGLNYDIRPASGLSVTAQAGWQFTQQGGIYSAGGGRHIYEMDGANGMYLHLNFVYRPSAKQGTAKRGM